MCGVRTKGWQLQEAREEMAAERSAKREARIPHGGVVGRSWAATEGAPENVFDVYWQPYGNGSNTMLNIL